jgi:hypothetical protein
VERVCRCRGRSRAARAPAKRPVRSLGLEIDFNDQAESVVAIHDRQAKLHCPQ